MIRTREDAIHFAECLKRNYTIDFEDMEVFCDMAELIDFKNGKIDADDVIEEFNRVTRMEVLRIIDKYRTESEVRDEM